MSKDLPARDPDLSTLPRYAPDQFAFRGRRVPPRRRAFFVSRGDISGDGPRAGVVNVAVVGADKEESDDQRG
jgi:hypothetical protein